MSIKIPLASDAREKGKALGLFGPTLEVFVRSGGRVRHEARVKAAVEAATIHARGRNVMAVLLCDLDAAGAGGILGTGLEGCPERHPAFQSLGSGRRYAQDGGAWDAAIEDARGVMDPKREWLEATWSWDPEKEEPQVVLENSRIRAKMGLSYLIEIVGIEWLAADARRFASWKCPTAPSGIKRSIFWYRVYSRKLDPLDVWAANQVLIAAEAMKEGKDWEPTPPEEAEPPSSGKEEEDAAVNLT